MDFPLTLDDYLFAVAKETARLSWPGRMWPILVAGAKKETEQYFTCNSFLAELKNMWVQKIPAYDSWHEERVVELATRIAKKVNPGYCPKAVAAKLMDIFMHQLMKYEEFRFLWADLHLVLDSKVFAALHALAQDRTALKAVRSILAQNPYKISTKQYKSVQRQLWGFVEELNRRPGHEFDLHSRIQLNVLWADGHRNDGCASHR